MDYLAVTPTFDLWDLKVMTSFIPTLFFSSLETFECNEGPFQNLEQLLQNPYSIRSFRQM